MVTRTIVLTTAFDHLADDTEETLVGSSFHQDAIVDTYVSLKRYRRQRNLPWFIGNQTKLVIPRTGGAPSYQPSPDLMIYPTLGSDGWRSIPVARYGPPALVMEVVSPSTALENDLNFGSPGGKPNVYAAIGVAEYLAFDLFGDYIEDQVSAWRLGPAGLYVPWGPDSSGLWVSTLGIAFAPRTRLLRVYDDQGVIIPNDEDMDDIADERARQIAELQAELRRLQGEG